jgi:amidase
LKATLRDDAATTLGRPVSEQDVEPVTWVTMQRGIKVPSVTYSRAIATLHQIGLAMAKFQRNYEVILSPTLAKPPVALGLLSLSQDVQTWSKEVIAGGYSSWPASSSSAEIYQPGVP